MKRRRRLRLGTATRRCLFSWGQEGGVLRAPEQSLTGVGGREEGASAEDADVPVVDYGEDELFEVFMREDWGNCEMRTFLVAY